MVTTGCVATGTTFFQIPRVMFTVIIHPLQTGLKCNFSYHHRYGDNRYGDSTVYNTVDENCSVFSLIRMCWLLSARACRQSALHQQSPPVKNWRCLEVNCIMAVKRVVYILCHSTWSLSLTHGLNVSWWVRYSKMHSFVGFSFIWNYNYFLFTGNITQLYEYLTKTNDLLVKNAGSLDNVRSTFTMQDHSLGILAVL